MNSPSVFPPPLSRASLWSRLVAGAPDWSLMSCAHLAELPAIRWKLQNLLKLKKGKPRKFSEQTGELRARFGA